MALTKLNTRQLISLFKVTLTPILSGRGKAIISELSRRGYFYDQRRGDFLTAEQWEQRHSEPPPVAQHSPVSDIR